jgi:hypothetical protein
MTQFFILWKRNNDVAPPTTPEQGVQQLEGFLALMRHQLTDGNLKEVHAFLRGDQGYAISKDVSQEMLFAELQAWQPFVTFEVHQTVPFPKALEMGLEVQRTLVKQMQMMQQKASA